MKVVSVVVKVAAEVKVQKGVEVSALIEAEVSVDV